MFICLQTGFHCVYQAAQAILWSRGWEALCPAPVLYRGCINSCCVVLFRQQQGRKPFCLSSRSCSLRIHELVHLPMYTQMETAGQCQVSLSLYTLYFKMSFCIYYFVAGDGQLYGDQKETVRSPFFFFHHMGLRDDLRLSEWEASVSTR